MGGLAKIGCEGGIQLLKIELYTCSFIFSIQQDCIAAQYWLYFHTSLVEYLISEQAQPFAFTQIFTVSGAS